MATATAKGSLQPGTDVHITFEDQQKINKFARLYAKFNELKEDINQKENNLRKLEDASDEIALIDEEEKIPYLVGEVFVYQTVEKANQSLEEAKKNAEQEIADLKTTLDELKELMSDLKTYLYGKFGSNINLEADED